MLTIKNFTVEHLTDGCVTDRAQPRFGYMVESDQNDTKIKSATLTVGEWSTQTNNQIAIAYGGAPLQPFTAYTATLTVESENGDKASATLTFQTGRMGTPWQAQWITDGQYTFTEKGVSPVPMTFQKQISLQKPIKKATLYATALGIYECEINGEKVGNDYFAPGFTSYKTTLQYQTYDVTERLTGNDQLKFIVAGGWAVGSFIFTRQNRITCDKQALLAELRLEYADGTSQVIGTDPSWQVTMDGNFTMVDIYDGETYDATVDLAKSNFHAASVEKVKIKPNVVATLGAMVRRHEQLTPISCKKGPSGELVYDFGQNFAGVVCAQINGKHGQIITFRHAEILKNDGSLNTDLLRSAKATATYTCVDGAQTYSPRMSYMGFRYVSVTGVDEKDITLSAYALYSDMEQSGSFECSNQLINRLQQNILWSSRSNFVDIPTDCPQRDERMGWTGDIAVFAQTACYNFDMQRFLEKWLNDVRAEQTKGGGIPNTVPVQGYGFPTTMPKKAIAFWGDACIFVPWAQYLAFGDEAVLRENYAMMKKYVKACKFWANIGVGKWRYIWDDIPMMQFGDWIAPDVSSMNDWQKRCRWTGTGSLAATTGLLAKIAHILGNDKDEKYYQKLNAKVCDAYVSLLTDGKGKLKEEFQTAYVLPLYFTMFPEEQRAVAAQNLANLVAKNDYCIGTGFPGTPYILFALADNGQQEAAFRMLTNTKCPSWLYEVKAGGTSIWERWDGLKEDGTLNTGAEDGTGGMVSFNHYASGAVGDFLYRRVLGVEPTTGGYQTFRVAPMMGGELTSAKGCVKCAFGTISAAWEKTEQAFTLSVSVPVGTQATIVLPSGKEQVVGSGNYTFSE